MCVNLGKTHLGVNLAFFLPKNVVILKIRIHATLGKSHLGANLAFFLLPKNVGILRIHIITTLVQTL